MRVGAGTDEVRDRNPGPEGSGPGPRDPWSGGPGRLSPTRADYRGRTTTPSPARSAAISPPAGSHPPARPWPGRSPRPPSRPPPVAAPPRPPTAAGREPPGTPPPPPPSRPAFFLAPPDRLTHSNRGLTPPARLRPGHFLRHIHSSP